MPRPQHGASTLRVLSSCCGCMLVAVALLLSAAQVAAQGKEGGPIDTSDYAVDLTQGVVLSTSRTVGLAGAATALAEGVEGGLSNPAAVAARSVGSVDSWDYWLAFGLTYPFQNGDFYNSGNALSQDREDTSGNFLFLNTGAYLQLLELGLGVNVELLQVLIRDKTEGAAERSVSLQLITSHIQLGYLLYDGQLALAVGLQVLSERATTHQAGMEPRRQRIDAGFGAELGMLIRPNGKQWRLGAGLYSRIRADYQASSSGEAQPNIVPPQYAIRPWRGNVGFAYQFGKRPLNPRWTYVEEHAQQPLQELDLRGTRARLDHEREMATLRQSSSRESIARQQAALREYADLLQLLDAERAAIKKKAWRELRAGMRTDWPRRYLLVAAELSFAGRVDNGVGVESFLTQTVQRSGERVSVTPRLALESEVWPTHVRVRAGSYVEASRFKETTARPHGTFGVDVRLFNWDVFRIWPEDYLWQLSAAVDASRDYNAVSVSFGGWY